MGRIPQYEAFQNPSQVTPSTIDAVAAPYKLGEKVADQGLKLSSYMKQAEEETKLNETSNEFQRGLIDLEDQYKQQRALNPDGAAKELDGEVKAFAEGYNEKFANNYALKNKWKRMSDNIRTNVFERTTQWENQQKIMNFGTSIEKSVTNIEAMAYQSGDLNQLDGFLKTADQTIDAGKLFMNPAKLEEARMKTRNTVAKGLMYGAIEKDPLAAKAVLDSGKYNETFNADQLRTFDSQITQQLTRQVAQAEKAAKLRFDDPAKWAKAQGNEFVPDIVAAQVNAGTPSARARILDNDEAKQMAAMVGNINSPEQLTNFVTDLSNEYGAYTPNVMNDLTREGKLSPAYSMLLSMAHKDDYLDGTTANSEEINTMFDLVNSPNNEAGEKRVVELAKNRLAVDGNMITRTNPEGFEAKYNSKFDEIGRIMTSEGWGAAVEDVRKQGLDLAYAQYNKVRDPDKATDFAVDWMKRGTSIMEYNGEKFRIPGNYDSNLIQPALKILGAKPVHLRESNGIIVDIKEKSVLESAHWVASPDLTSLRLVTDKGEPLINKSGRVAEYNFLELAAIGRKARSIDETPRSKMLGRTISSILGPEAETADLNEIVDIIVNRKARPGSPLPKSKQPTASGKSETAPIDQFEEDIIGKIPNRGQLIDVEPPTNPEAGN